MPCHCWSNYLHAGAAWSPPHKPPHACLACCSNTLMPLLLKSVRSLRSSVCKVRRAGLRCLARDGRRHASCKPLDPCAP